MNIRVRLEEDEERLHPKAARSALCIRKRPENKAPNRTEFQRDRDRILHSKSFRRLKHKTQVFISPGGDHFRTRLTHTLEVSQIARTIARALNLNEDLTEAIALGHDLGHTPFGHTGERVLDQLMKGGFHHYKQSLRVVDKLEYHGKGLNLTREVRNGIVMHSKGKGPIIPEDRALLPGTLEGQVVRVSDIVAYINHDIDDALRAKMITEDDIPADSKKLLGNTFARRIDTAVNDVIQRSMEHDLNYIAMSDDIYAELLNLRDFLYQTVYWVKESEEEIEKITKLLHRVYEYVLQRPDRFINPYPETDPVERRVMDFIAGMTDRYALNLFKEITFPAHNIVDLFE